MNNDLICPYCGKICKNKNSYAQHTIRCPKNPDKIPSGFTEYNKKGTPWNKGLSGDIRCKHSEETKKKISEKSRVSNQKRKERPDYDEYVENMRNLALERGLGGFHFRRGVMYNDIKLDSSYEFRVAKSLDDNNIKWERCSKFVYFDNKGLKHTYTPDFYLPEYDIYLDPKNDYLINNIRKGWEFSDKTKIDWVMKQNNIKILILDKDNLSWERIKSKLII